MLFNADSAFSRRTFRIVFGIPILQYLSNRFESSWNLVHEPVYMNTEGYQSNKYERSGEESNNFPYHNRSPPLRAFRYNAVIRKPWLGYDDRVDLFELFAFAQVQHTEILKSIHAAFLQVRAIRFVVSP